MELAERSMRKRLELTVRGRGQNVGFRAFVHRHATALGLTGEVANGSDGRSVCVVAEGEADRLATLLGLVERGPLGARVDSVEHSCGAAMYGDTSFRIR